MTVDSDPLPLVFAGPILRRSSPERLVLWLAVREPVRLRITIDAGEASARDTVLTPGETTSCRLLTAGTYLHYLLIDLAFDEPLPSDRWIGYEVAMQPLTQASAGWQGCTDAMHDLCYPGKQSPGFVLPTRVGSLLHGSCRKPHHPGGDGLVEADRLLARCLASGDWRRERESAAPEDTHELPVWPSALVLTGDQVYADDVAGPMLHAIHQVIAMLGLPDERLSGGELIRVHSAQSLYRHPAGFYRRETLLPRHKRNHALIEVLFGGVEKPVFTTASAHNHLITLGEVLAMYLLAWSPALWKRVDLDPPPGLDAASQSLYRTERAAMEGFAAALAAVRRVFAHLPVAMIFDDHDITDDWNLSREWEEVAYGHPFSKRVIGNALFGYLLNQAWGNNPDAFGQELFDTVQASLNTPGNAAHDECIDQLLRFDHWHYSWPTAPPLVVIDSRTHRWRSESAARKPSGLMDWESLTDLQQTLRGLPAVLLVSPTPIFGVKLIEAIQRIFTWFGQPLLVDAENWMAHPGSAHAILNIFRHPKTPQHFVVLSGDVHYSFVYDVELRGRVRGPDIWQICSSAIRNDFPPRLLDVLDRANRWLYSPRSPLNWLTQRRNMRVIPRKPEGTPHGRRLLNGSGIGLVEIDAQGVPWRIRELLTDGRVVSFSRREAESRWD
jgi:hypothetical protein